MRIEIDLEISDYDEYIIATAKVPNLDIPMNINVVGRGVDVATALSDVADQIGPALDPQFR